MRTRLLRYVGALIVSLVSTYSGLQRQAYAEAKVSCNLSDVAAWQMALENPADEGTPAYMQAVSEAFIERCPGRPEIAEAHRIAGMSAAWEDRIDEAADHFDKAGYITDAETLLMHAAVRLALGETERAWAMRDEAIEHWISRLVRRGLASVEIEDSYRGELIRVTFSQSDPETRLSSLWIAKPNGEGWPAALSVSSERQLTAFHRLVAGDDAPALRYVRFYRCNARRLLARSQTPLSDDDVAEAARLDIVAYLANPDIPRKGALQPCLFDGEILPEIDPVTAIPLQ